MLYSLAQHFQFIKLSIFTHNPCEFIRSIRYSYLSFDSGTNLKYKSINWFLYEYKIDIIWVKTGISIATNNDTTIKIIIKETIFWNSIFWLNIFCCLISPFFLISSNDNRLRKVFEVTKFLMQLSQVSW